MQCGLSQCAEDMYLITRMWIKEETCNLIELYREYSVLWGPSCMDYKNKFKKMAALKQRGNLLDITRDEVDRNFSLLGYYAASCGNFIPTFGTAYRSNLRKFMSHFQVDP